MPTNRPLTHSLPSCMSAYSHCPLTTTSIPIKAILATMLIKTKLSFRTTYQYYDQNGQYLSCAYQRMFSLGSFYTWACVMDIYDSQGNTLGLIEGSILTLLPSKFNFYMYQPTMLLVVAYMDKDCMGFTVFDPARTKPNAHHCRSTSAAFLWKESQ